MPDLDHMTDTEELRATRNQAARIREHWAAQGIAVNVRIERVPAKGNEDGMKTVWGIRSDIRQRVA